MVATIIISAILLITILWAAFTSNNLVAKRNRVRQCRSGICIAIKQRNDMIPNLVAAVKAYMGHENEILTRIAELRSRSQSESDAGLVRDGNEISSLLARLNITVENYPNLKANDQFLELQARISDMEIELQAIRRTCNAAITAYNNVIEMFPSSVVASLCHHEPERLIEIPQSELHDVDVSNLFRN